MPEQPRDFMRLHQWLCYDVRFKAAAFALRICMAEPRICGATTIGFRSVLHTFGDDLVYHPHIHTLMPCGSLDDDGNWKSTRPGFVVPVKKLSKEFREELERLVGAQRMQRICLPPSALTYNDPHHRVGKIDCPFVKPRKPDFGGCDGYAFVIALV